MPPPTSRLQNSIDRIATETFDLWYEYAEDYYTLRAVPHLSKTLPALAKVNRVYNGVPLRVWLCQQLSNEGHKRRLALKAIENMDKEAATPEVLAALRELLKDKDEDVRFDVAGALGNMEEKAKIPEVLEELRELLKDKDEDVRYNAAKALEKMGERENIPEVSEPLLRLLKPFDYPDEKVRKLLKDDSGNAFHSVSNALGLLESKDWNVRRSAAKTLGSMSERVTTTAVLAGLVKLLNDEQCGARLYVGEALELIWKAGGRYFDNEECLFVRELARGKCPRLLPRRHWFIMDAQQITESLYSLAAQQAVVVSVRADTFPQNKSSRLRQTNLHLLILPELANPFAALPDGVARYRRLLERSGAELAERLLAVSEPVVCLMGGTGERETLEVLGDYLTALGWGRLTVPQVAQKRSNLVYRLLKRYIPRL